MTDSNHSHDHHSANADDGPAAAWADFEERLAAHLAIMVDPDERDHLIIEVPGSDEIGTAPYAQFAGFGAGRMVRAELTGDTYLSATHQLDEGRSLILRALGWQGNDEGEANWFLDRPLSEARDVAAEAVRALQHVFAIPHPHLLTWQAWGPSAAHVDTLGLTSTADVPAEAPSTPVPDDAGGLLGLTVIQPRNRDELLHVVREILREIHGEPPAVDSDGSFVVLHEGHPVRVRVPVDDASVEVSSCVARGVHSRRTAAVEMGLLNRDHRWTKWVLRERDVWQVACLPGRPFVPPHFERIFDLYLQALIETGDDLAHRTGGRAD